MPDWIVWLAAPVAVGLLARRLMSAVLKPSWEIMKTTVHLAEVKRTLIEIAEQFKPNDGTSLRDVVEHLAEGQECLTDAIDSLTSKVDAFILDRKPNGQRHTDPKV